MRSSPEDGIDAELIPTGYCDSRTHRDRQHSFSGGSVVPRHHSTRYDSHGSTSANAYATPAVAIPQRPVLPQRNSSNSGSAMESVAGSPSSTFGSPPWQNSRSYSYSTSYSSSRRPSDAMASLDERVRTRTDSVSSESSEYGIDGVFGCSRDTDDNRNISVPRRDHQSSRSYQDRRR